MSPVLGLYWLPNDWRVGLLEAASHQADALLAAGPPCWRVTLDTRPGRLLRGPRGATGLCVTGGCN
jgi:hypothetical protein